MKKNTLRHTSLAILICVFILWGWLKLGIAPLIITEDFAKAAQIGDMFALFGSMTSGISVVFVSIALMLQVLELKERKKSDMENLKRQESLQKLKLEEIKIQQKSVEDSATMSLLSSLEKILSICTSTLPDDIWDKKLPPNKPRSCTLLQICRMFKIIECNYILHTVIKNKSQNQTFNLSEIPEVLPDEIKCLDLCIKCLRDIEFCTNFVDEQRRTENVRMELRNILTHQDCVDLDHEIVNPSYINRNDDEDFKTLKSRINSAKSTAERVSYMCSNNSISRHLAIVFDEYCQAVFLSIYTIEKIFNVSKLSSVSPTDQDIIKIHRNRGAAINIIYFLMLEYITIH